VTLWEGNQRLGRPWRPRKLLCPKQVNVIQNHRNNVSTTLTMASFLLFHQSLVYINTHITFFQEMKTIGLSAPSLSIPSPSNCVNFMVQMISALWSGEMEFFQRYSNLVRRMKSLPIEKNGSYLMAQSTLCGLRVWIRYVLLMNWGTCLVALASYRR
jgi:hypothetical protein